MGSTHSVCSCEVLTRSRGKMCQWSALPFCWLGFHHSLTSPISSPSPFLVFLLSFSSSYSFTPFRGRTCEPRKVTTRPSKTISFSILVFPHPDHSQWAFWVFRLLHRTVCVYSKSSSISTPFFNRPCFLICLSWPSLFSPAAPCNANTTCSEGKWIIEAAAAVLCMQKWAAEEGRREGREGGMRVDEGNVV